MHSVKEELVLGHDKKHNHVWDWLIQISSGEGILNLALPASLVNTKDHFSEYYD